MSLVAGYVYVCDPGTGLIKVGQSAEPAKRLKTIAGYVGCPDLKSWVSPRVCEYKRLERESHAKLSEWRIAGEWFNCSMELAVAAVQSLLKNCTSPRHALRARSNELAEAMRRSADAARRSQEAYQAAIRNYEGVVRDQLASRGLDLAGTALQEFSTDSAGRVAIPRDRFYEEVKCDNSPVIDAIWSQMCLEGGIIIHLT
ncbi:GIY-YIG nuclease family protein [Massilia sp. BHUDP2]|uniref:GIY-YIG nuclease family protein n=1 Tax=Massilia sp. BHUDP2 TaxID=3034505 RepID=UPI003906CD53